MRKKTNFEIKFICKKLGLEENREFYSPEIERLIKTNTRMKKKVVLKNCESSIIMDMYDLWESKELTVPGNNGIESLAKFIHETFSIPKKRGGKGYLALAGIKSVLYKLNRKN